MSTKRVLVMRATGAQGRGAIKWLITTGWHVHALVADASSERALALKNWSENLALFQGTWTDPASIATAIEGCQALFLNQLPSFTDDSELKEARVVLDLVKTACVQHIVFPTTLVLNNPNIRNELRHSSTAPAVLGKAHIEELVKESGCTWTLLRPGYFLTNFLPPLVHWMFPEFKNGKFINSYGPDCVLTLVDPEDIGAFVVAAFENPTKFGGRTIPVVGENMRVDDIISALEESTGSSIEAVYRTLEETERLKENPLIASHRLSIGLERFVDMEEVRSWGVRMTSVKEFLEKHKHELKL